MPAYPFERLLFFGPMADLHAKDLIQVQARGVEIPVGADGTLALVDRLIEGEVGILVKDRGPLRAAFASRVGRLAREALVLPVPKLAVEVLAVVVVGDGVDLQTIIPPPPTTPGSGSCSEIAVRRS